MKSKVKPLDAAENTVFYRTKHGNIIRGDSLKHLATLKPESVDLIVTSPPFGLVRKKVYGNVGAHDYLEWFRPFGEAFKRALKANGSFVISCN